MITYESRIGRFTSSKIFRLVGTPAVTKTYVSEKKAERFLGRSIDLGKSTSSMVWGKVAEAYLHEYVLDFGYEIVSKDTIIHPKYPFWSGSPDFKKLQTAVESKCYEPKKYFELSYIIYQVNEGIKSIEDFKKEFPDVYWQVVSNSILLEVPKCEIIAFMPTLNQLEHIRQLLCDENFGEKLGLNPWEYRFIYEKPIHELPYIPEHSNWLGLYKLEFEPSQSDKDFLETSVLKAEEILTK